MMEFKYGSYGAIAARDLVSAQKNCSIEEYNVVGVYCQQCLEKIAKHYHQQQGLGQDISNLMRSHKITTLYRGIRLEEGARYLDQLYTLTDCYFDTRYPGEDYFELTREAAHKYLKATEIVFAEMCRIILSGDTAVFD